MASEALFDLRSHISDLRLSALCLCASAPLHLTKLSSFVIVFMQNKANFQKSQMNANLYNTKDYENKSNWTLGENKPNSNPIKPNLHFTAENTEYAEKKDISVSDCSIEKYALYPISPRSLRTRRLMKNKPNSNPIQSQSKPILERMNVNFCATGYYESKPTFAVRKGRPVVPYFLQVLAAFLLGKEKPSPGRQRLNNSRLDKNPFNK